MQVETANAPATTSHVGQRFHFCSDHCREAFEQRPDRHVTTAGPVGDPADSTEPDLDAEHGGVHAGGAEPPSSP